MTAVEIDALFACFANMKVAVVGDVMLDTYWWGNVERISPEAPVPIVSLKRKEYRIGGAGNVALNLVALGAHTTLFSVIGNDAEGRQLSELLGDHHIATQYLVKSDGRTTTNKTRVMSRNQQMMRLDAEVTFDIDAQEETALLNNFERFITTEKPDAIIFEDYNKGVLSTSVISSMIAAANRHNIITAVDPKRKNFFAYQGVTLFKPNLKEVYEGLNILAGEISTENLGAIHQQLHNKLHHDISLITLSEKGVFYQQGEQAGLYGSHVRNIADVSGAGDTVIAVASLVYAATKNMQATAAIANIAGGLVCEEVGTAAIDKQKLLFECKALLPS